MKLETYLNAYGQAVCRWTYADADNIMDDDDKRLRRMIVAFYARILRMFEDLEDELDECYGKLEYYVTHD